jgi:hypothetical protein
MFLQKSFECVKILFFRSKNEEIPPPPLPTPLLCPQKTNTSHIIQCFYSLFSDPKNVRFSKEKCNFYCFSNFWEKFAKFSVSQKGGKNRETTKK